VRPLRALAHVRTGDKGDTSQVSVIAYDAADYPTLVRALTVERVRRHLSSLSVGSVQRYELPRLGALNFVLERALGGGVTRSVTLDAHGKTLGAQLLDLEIDDGTAG
jgi:hypothetical protein